MILHQPASLIFGYSSVSTIYLITKYLKKTSMEMWIMSTSFFLHDHHKGIEYFSGKLIINKKNNIFILVNGTH